MKVAIAVWKGRLAPVFDVARQLLLLEVRNNGIFSREYVELRGNPAGRLRELGVEVLICGAISQPVAWLAASGGIKIISFIAGGVEEVIAAYLAGTLPSAAFAMPGCCMRRRCRRGRALGGRGRRGWNF